MIIRLAGESGNKIHEELLAALEAGGAALTRVRAGQDLWVVVSRLTGQTRDLLEGSPLVAGKIDQDGGPFFVSRRFCRSETIIGSGTDRIGAGHFQIIAGPCAIESSQQALRSRIS